mmetsp:Transcript_11386/g.17016  ORF Transcript_11386/g.17016 Transcript_11386/m.17016 type:complete len:173 (+) Transcript_11386:57-575(+)
MRMIRRLPFTSRRLVRYNANWAYLSKTVGDAVAPIKEEVDQMEMEIYSAPGKVTPIDFKAWEEKVGKEAVAVCKKFYEEEWLKKLKPQVTQTFSEEDIKTVQTLCAETVAEAQDMEDWHRLRLRELEIEIAKLKDEITKLNELDVEAMAKRYPHVEERVAKEAEEGIYGFKP